MFETAFPPTVPIKTNQIIIEFVGEYPQQKAADREYERTSAALARRTPA